MPKSPFFNSPHLLGQVYYSEADRFSPDGDTIHLRDPVLLIGAQRIKPTDGKLSVWGTGSSKPKTIRLKSNARGIYAPVRFEGLDAPEEHYRSTPFTLKHDDGSETKHALNPAVKHEDRAQPQWSPATQYAVGTLLKAGWALIDLDPEVVDRYGRVLGYVYASDAKAKQGVSITLNLIKRGLAFPFVFESAGDRIPPLLKAASAARAKRKGVWKHYREAPLPYAASYPKPTHYTDPEPPEQLTAPLNLPMVFRRIVDAEQLQGLSFAEAVRKYDCIEYPGGRLVPGDRYQEIPVDKRIWAPHRYS